MAQPIVKILTNPMVIVSVGVILLFVTNYLEGRKNNKTDTYLDTLQSKLDNNTHTKDVAAWVKKNEMKTIGMICYAGTALALAPPSQKPTWMAYGLLAAYLIPEPSAYEYVYQCLAFAVYLQLKSRQLKTLVMASVVIMYALGYYVS